MDSCLVEGDERLYLPNCESNLDIALCLLYRKFVPKYIFHLGRN